MESTANKGPSSLLPPDPERHKRTAEPPSKQSPSSLLPETPAELRVKRVSDDVVAVSPRSLLPELPTDPIFGPKREELAAVSPSELLPPSPPQAGPLRSINWKIVASVGAALLVALLAYLSATHVTKKSAPELFHEATAYMESGNRTAAAIQLKNALQIDPNHIEARLMHGRLLLDTGEFRAAEDDFRRAQELGAKREIVLPLLARALIARKEYQVALDTTAPGPNDDPTKQSPEVIALRGQALLYLGRKDQARETFESALSVDADQPDALLGLARVALLDRDRNWAWKSINRAVAIAPTNADILALMADLTRLSGDETKAAEFYEKAIANAPNNHAMRLSLVSIHISAKEYDKASKHLDYVLMSVPDSATANFLYATIEFRREKYIEARNFAAKVLNVQGNHVPSLLLVGASAFIKRDYAIAEKALRRALVLVPGHLYARKMLGASLVRLNRPRDALEELLPLVKRMPKDADLFATIGEAYLDVSDFTRATQFLENSAALAPKNPAARLGLGRTRLASGELDRAVEDLEAAQALAPQGREAKFLLAMAHLRRKEFDRTIAIVGEMDPKLRGNPVALNVLSAAYIGKGDFPTATKYLEQALVLSPDYMPAVMNLVQIYMREKDARAAVRRLETVVKHSPKNVQAMFALASILSEVPDQREEALRWLERAQQVNPESAEPLLRLARYHLSRGAPKEALAAAQRGLDMQINNAEVLDSLGQVQLAARAHRQAVDTYVRMVSEYPKSALAHYRLGVAQQLSANSAGARQSFRGALALQPDYVEAKVQLAQLEVKAGNTEVALQLARELQQQLPKSPLGLVLKGDVLALDNRFAEAIPAFEAAYAIEKTSALVLKLHQAYAQSGKIERGERIVDDWLQQQPRDLRTRQFVADYSMSVKRYPVAQRHYEVLVATMPKNQQVLNNLAIVYDRLGDQRALETADRAYHLNTRNPYVADTYGWMLVRLARPERGRDILKEAVAQAPAIPDMRYHYAVALAKSGQRKEARSELERAFTLKGKLSYEVDAKKLLEQLKN